MKKITRLLLINWHYYSVEMIEFSDINFLTGKTGAGKSTVVDAMQIVLLGDTNGQHFFNKAANDRSRRTLKGYLRGEYGDDGDAGYVSLRGDKPFSSYIVCEFFDTEKDRYLTVGTVFDCNYTAQDESTFFILKERIPENRFIIKEYPLAIKDLKIFFKREYTKNSFEFCESGRAYQSKIKSLFGGLKDNFFGLFKKAVSFTPIADIEDFITSNICDNKNNVDISAMQENLRQYRKLEQEAKSVKSRIEHLEKISEAYVGLSDEKQKLDTYQFLIDRSELEQYLEDIKELEKERSIDEDELVKETTLQARLAVLSSEKSLERDRLIEQRGNNNVYQKQQMLEKEKAEIEEKINMIESAMKKIINRLHIYALNWRSAAEDTETLVDQVKSVANIGIMESEIYALSGALENLKESATILLDIRTETIFTLDCNKYQKLKLTGDTFRGSLSNLGLMLGKLVKSAEHILEDCEDKINDLRQNIKPYDKPVLILRNEIQESLSRQYKKEIEVSVLADLLEIPDHRWVNTIEGYMNRQKQYLLVSPEYFSDALKIYDRVKFEKGLYDVGLIDGEKVLNSKPLCLKRSLSEEIITNDPYARSYVDFLLGRVIKCDRVEDLRKYERAVTNTGMLYQGFVASQINPALWRKPLIGKKAIQDQILMLEKEKPRLELEFKQAQAAGDKFKNIRQIDTMSQNESDDNIKMLEDAAGVPGLQMRKEQIIQDLGRLDLAWVHEITKQIESLRIKIADIQEQERKILPHIGKLKGRIEEVQDNLLPTARKNAENKEGYITDHFSKEWRQSTGEDRFKQELANKKSPLSIINDYRSQVGMRKNQIDRLTNLLTNLRSDYNSAYGYSYDVSAKDNKKYDKTLIELRDEQLPQYMGKITEAKSMAYEQFVSHFLAELKANIDDVTERISELNKALKDYRWGNEQFSFSVMPNQEYRHFYDMIMDPLLMSGYNIASQMFIDKHGTAIDELFSKIVDYGTVLDADSKQEMDKNIRIFTDYKTYLRFDMHSVDQEENRQRLSKTLLKKSGGETQTPFYIAMLASFAQLYHIRDRNWNCIRLIIFDEAFSKMDGERIRESIHLLRSIGFQCILSAPPEKIGDIAPLVDRNIVVIKKGRNSFTRFFENEQLMVEFEGNQGDE